MGRESIARMVRFMITRMRNTLTWAGALVAIGACGTSQAPSESPTPKATPSATSVETQAPAAPPNAVPSASPLASSSAVAAPAFVLPKVPRTGAPARAITFTKLDGPKKSAADFCDSNQTPTAKRSPYGACKVGQTFPVGNYPALKSAITKVTSLTMPPGPNQRSSVGLLVETPAGVYASYSAVFPNYFIKASGTYVSTNVSTEGDVLILTTRASDSYQVDAKDAPPPVFTIREIAVLCVFDGTPRCSEPIRIAETAESKTPLKGEPKWAWQMAPHVTPSSIEFTSASPKAIPAPTESPEWEITGRVLPLGVYPHP